MSRGFRPAFRSPFSLPLAASIALHGGIVLLLIMLVGRMALLPRPPKPAIEIMLTPPPPPGPRPPAAIEPPPPAPVVKAEPPPSPAPPPPVVMAEPPPPRQPPRSKPVVVRRPPPRERPREPVVEQPPPAPYRPAAPAPAPGPPPPQAAAVPRPPPLPAAPAGPVVSPAYRAALGDWLERHKRYPESARQRGEAGQAVLRFHVERSGRVLDYAVVKSTGYAELDAAIDRMMQGATLPPFPADMSAGDIEVSVTLRFALAR